MITPEGLFEQLGYGLVLDTPAHLVVFDRFHVAVKFRRYFGDWDIRCRLVAGGRQLEIGVRDTLHRLARNRKRARTRGLRYDLR